MSAGPISLRSAQDGHELVLDGSGAPAAWKKSDSFTRTSLPVCDQDLEELVLLVALDAQPAQRLLGARRRGRRPRGTRPRARRRPAAAPGVSRISWEAEPHLVPLALDDALRLERGQQLGEDPLVGVAGPAAQLLARHARRAAGFSGGTPRGAPAVCGRAAGRSLSRCTYHSRSTATTRPPPAAPSSSARSRSGPKGIRARRSADPRARRRRRGGGAPPDPSGLPVGEQRQVGDERRALALEARRRDVEQGAAADRHDRRVGADDEAVARQRDQRRLQPEAREGRTRRARAPGGPAGARAPSPRWCRRGSARGRASSAAAARRPAARACRRPGPWARACRPGATHVAALDGGPLHALQVHRGALAGAGLRSTGVAVHLQAAHLGLQRRAGYTSTRSSTARRPAISVPVTTVPKPLMVNTRSIGRRAVLVGAPRRAPARPGRASAARSSARPAPVFDGHRARSGSPSRKVPRTSAGARPRAPARASRARPGRSWSARPARSGCAAASRWRGARASAASRPRRRRSPAGPGRCRPRRPACS